MIESDHKRQIRSFVRREGRMTGLQREALETLWPRYGINFVPKQIDFSQIFGNVAALTLEIGFGMGQSLVQMAQSEPQRNFLGIEVHRPGVGSLLHALHEQGVNNVRVMQHDAVEVLRVCVPDGSLQTVQIFFPDPWPKKRHHKRRIIQTEFVQLLATKLQVGGVLHVATDWQPYAEHMQMVLAANIDFCDTVNSAVHEYHVQQRPQTKFEMRGERLGHAMWDGVYQKINSSDCELMPK